MLGALAVSVRVATAGAGSTRPARIPLCRRRELPTGRDIVTRTVTFRARRGPAVETVAKTVLLTRDEEDRPLAMLGECTHLSCPVSAAGGRSVRVDSPDAASTPAPLRCPCHGGAFSRLGAVVDGPPPAPLRRLELEIPESENAVVHVLGL